jgi:hypothetical protein
MKQKLSPDTKITVNGVEYSLSDLSDGDKAMLKHIDHSRKRIFELELDLGQARMAHDGFISALEKSLEHKNSGNVAAGKR